MRKCINCKWCNKNLRCFNPLFTSNTTNSTRGWKSDISIQRNAGFLETFIHNLCGKSGRYFEPKSF